MKELTKKFIEYFEKLNSKNSEFLKEIYHESIKFKDPLHEIQGIDELIIYFEKLNQKVLNGGFEFVSTYETDSAIILEWKMKLESKKSKIIIDSTGISVLKILNSKIIEQRDYFDLGGTFYEKIPLLGGIIKFIKSKL